MSALRKFRVTRKTSRFTSHRLRSHWSLNAFKSAKKGLQYDPYKKKSWRYAPLFHDVHKFDDPVVRLTGLTPSEIEDNYVPFSDVLAEGLADRRYYSPGVDVSSYIPAEGRTVARIPAQIRHTKYLVAPPSPVVQPAGVKNQYLQFSSPRQVLTCVRRKQRREVLLAFGKGGSKHKRPEWREESYIRC